MTTLKPGEAMSHGRIMRIKKEEMREINRQIDVFFKSGGKVEEVESGKSGLKADAKFKFSI